MDLENILLNLGEIADNLTRAGTSVENWYDDHSKRKARRRDEELARHTDAEYRYFAKDYQIHPERYNLVSKASVKAARKRLRKNN